MCGIFTHVDYMTRQSRTFLTFQLIIFCKKLNLFNDYK